MSDRSRDRFPFLTFFVSDKELEESKKTGKPIDFQAKIDAAEKEKAKK